MMTEPDEIQRRWARVVGFSYLFALAPAVFAEFYVSGRLHYPRLWRRIRCFDHRSAAKATIVERVRQ